MAPGRTSSRGEKDAARRRKEAEEDDEISVEEAHVLPARATHNDDEDQEEQKLTSGIDEKSLKAAVWYTVAQIAQEEEIELGRSMSESFVASLTELVYAQAEHLALELKAFAAHAGRSTIREEDVKLVCRKSSVLQELLDEEARRISSGPSTSSKLTSTAPPKNPAPTTKKPKPKPTRVGGLAAAINSARNPSG